MEIVLLAYFAHLLASCPTINMKSFLLLSAYLCALLLAFFVGGRFASTSQPATQKARPNVFNIAASKLSGHFFVVRALSGRTQTKCFIDSGAHNTLISATWAKKLNLTLRPSDQTFAGLGGTIVQASGLVTLTITMGGRNVSIDAFVIPHVPVTNQVLLGMDWLEKHEPIIHWKKGKLHFGTGSRAINAISVNPELKTTTTGTVPADILATFSVLFAEPTALPPSRPGLDMELKLSGDPLPSKEIPIRQEGLRLWMREQIQDLLAKGFITRIANAKFNPAPAFVVVDHASESRGEAKKRIVYDYRNLNAVTQVAHAILPRILDLVRLVSSSRVFSKMDLRAGFHNLRVHPDSVQATVFSCPEGLFVWNVMPFGLSGAPGSMQALMREKLSDFVGKGVEVYLDDVVIHASTVQEHDRLLALVLRKLEDDGFHLKASKCALRVDTIDFLGFRIGNGLFSAMQSHVNNIINFANPRTCSNSSVSTV
jgi:predicted aspartyl protease